jgi:hypothetical protein
MARGSTVRITIDTVTLARVRAISRSDRVPIAVVVEAALSGFFEDWEFRHEWSQRGMRLPSLYSRARRRAKKGGR